MVYTPKEALDRESPFIKPGMKLIIVAAKPVRLQKGNAWQIQVSGGKEYLTMGEYLMKDLATLAEKSFDFSQGFAVEVVEHIAEESGNPYFTFESPTKEDLAKMLSEAKTKTGKE